MRDFNTYDFGNHLDGPLSVFCQASMDLEVVINYLHIEAQI